MPPECRLNGAWQGTAASTHRANLQTRHGFCSKAHERLHRCAATVASAAPESGTGNNIGKTGRTAIMRRIHLKPLVASAVLLATLASYGNAYAQGAPQAITEKRTDVVQLASGYRASKLNGVDVYNRNKDTIGTLDDLIVSPGADHGTYAILSVGGFLGMGKHLVAVPFADLQINNRRVVLPEATKQSIEAMPEFKYAPD
jgi:hypothetical protein